MPVKKHLHTYRRSTMNLKTYRCVDPSCTHFARKELIQGKFAACPSCGEKFILTHEKLDLAVPKCDNCKVKNKLNAEINKVFKEMEDKIKIKGIPNETIGS